MGGVAKGVADIFQQPKLPEPPPPPEPLEATDASTDLVERQRQQRRRRQRSQTPTVIGGLGVDPNPGVARTVLGGGGGV